MECIGSDAGGKCVSVSVGRRPTAPGGGGRGAFESSGVGAGRGRLADEDAVGDGGGPVRRVMWMRTSAATAGLVWVTLKTTYLPLAKLETIWLATV